MEDYPLYINNLQIGLPPASNYNTIQYLSLTHSVNLPLVVIQQMEYPQVQYPSLDTNHKTVYFHESGWRDS